MDGTEPTIQSLLSNTSTGGSTKIDGSTITTGKIRSNNWSTTLGSELDLNAGTIKLGGSTSPKFNVNASGDVTASSALFSGSVSVTGNINATSGNIGGFAITRDAITGSGFYLSGSATGNGFFISSSKFNVKANGDVTGSSVLFTGGTFSGTVTVGGTALTEANTLNSNTTATNVGLGSVQNLNAQSQAQTGINSGTTITGGGITLSNGGSIKGGQSAFNIGTGFFLGYESSAYKFSIGNASTNYLTWDGSTFAVGGTIAATAGNIGGFTISNNSLSNGSNFYISGSATGNGFFISSSKFNVKANGDVTGSNVLFTGGKIGGSFIDTTKIVAGAAASSGKRVEIDGANATLKFFNATQEVIKIDDALISTHPGMALANGTLRIIETQDFGGSQLGAPIYVAAASQTNNVARTAIFGGIGNGTAANTQFVNAGSITGKSSCTSTVASRTYHAGGFFESNSDTCLATPQINAGVVCAASATTDYSLYGLRGILYNTNDLQIGGKTSLGNLTSSMNVLQVDHTGADGNDGIMIVRNDTSTLADDTLGGIGFDSTDGNVPSSIFEASAYIAAYAAETTGTSDKGGNLVFGTSPLNKDQDTISSERMRITYDGKVGIGQTDPNATLHVEAPSVTIASLTFGATSGQILRNELSELAIGLHNASPHPLYLQARTSTNTGRNMAINPLGGTVAINRGITAAVTNALEVGGTAAKDTAGSWVAHSDQNIKTQINTVSGSLDRINKVRLVSFKYKDAYKQERPSIEDKFYVNVIAQEFQEIYPDAVTETVEIFEDKKILQVDTHQMTIDAVASIQELHKIIQSQQSQINELKTRLNNAGL